MKSAYSGNTRLRSLTFLIAIVGFPLASYAEAKKDSQADRDEYLRLYATLAEAVARIEQDYARPVDRRQLFESALDGMLHRLDPYSAYLPPEEFERYREMGRPAKRGLGIKLAISEGRIVILGVQPGSPAEAQGIHPGDWLLAVEGQRYDGRALGVVERRLERLPTDASVRLTLRDPDAPDSRSVELRSARLTPPTVLGLSPKALGNGKTIAYFRLLSFAADTESDLRAALFQCKSQGVRGLILDLRFNAGGLLDSAIEVADLFLSEGLIVAVVGRDVERRESHATREGAFFDVPMVVLVNRFSASASEVVAAALQDNDRAAIIGERTWGKGSVQNVVELDEGRRGMKLTTAFYVRPGGENIHRFPDSSDADLWGVSPDEGFALALSGDQAKALRQSWRSQSTTNETTASEPSTSDPQLELAIQQLKQILNDASPLDPSP